MILNSECLSPGAIISSHTSVSAAVFKLHVYSGETEDDLKPGEGTIACIHWWGKTKTTDGLCSVLNPDFTSNPVFPARMSAWHAEPDTPSDHSDLNLAEQGIIKKKKVAKRVSSQPEVL